MLGNLLSFENCAECRMCCRFDRYNVLETPVFTSENVERIREIFPDSEFIAKKGGFIYRIKVLSDMDGFTCPALAENGCILGDDKPFDCKIWPFCIMNVGGRRAITIAHICDEMFSRPLSELVGFLKNGLADEIFAFADLNPDIVRPYYEGYPVLLFERKLL